MSVPQGNDCLARADWDSAIVEFAEDIEKATQKGVPAAPNAPLAKAYAGRGYARCFNDPKDGKYTEAIDDLCNAIHFDPANYRAYRQRAYAYWLNKQYERAIADCNTVIANANGMDVAFVHELLGDICMRLENYTDAIEHYSNAMQQNYGSPGLLDKYLSVCNKIHNL